MPINVFFFGLLILLAIAFFVLGHRKKHKTSAPPSTHSKDPKKGTSPKPNPGKPPVTPPGQPEPPPLPPEDPNVLIDRNGKRPGDSGYDPRIDEPRDKFSPAPPYGAFYGQGPFDPDAPWYGPDGYHWTDRNGVHHGPGG